MAKKIMLIRHGEKPSDDDSVRGVSEDGKHDPNELSVAGWQRSGALVRFFAPANGQLSHPSLAKPDAIFAAAVSGHVESLRSQHTVSALAKFLGLHMNIRHTKGEEEALVKDMLATDGAVLAAWEHNAILDIVKFLMGVDKAPSQKWPDSRFDLVWVFDRSASGWTFTQVPQMLLPGDSPHTA